MWSLDQVKNHEIDEATKGIFNQYKHSLAYIGVDFDREDVREAVISCAQRMEGVFQCTIEYWLWTKQNNQKLEYPNAFLIKALTEHSV